MEGGKLTAWIFIYTLVNLAASPTALYFIFKDFNFPHIPQTWQNVLSEIFLFFGALYYLYLASWLLVICCPVTEEKWKESDKMLSAPIGVCFWVSIFQAQWTIMGIILAFVCVLGCLSGCVRAVFIPDTDNESVSSDNSENGPLIVRTVEVTRTVTLYTENE